jgi:hypothetical protein
LQAYEKCSSTAQISTALCADLLYRIFSGSEESAENVDKILFTPLSNVRLFWALLVMRPTIYQRHCAEIYTELRTRQMWNLRVEIVFTLKQYSSQLADFYETDACRRSL